MKKELIKYFMELSVEDKEIILNELTRIYQYEVKKSIQAERDIAVYLGFRLLEMVEGIGNIDESIKVIKKSGVVDPDWVPNIIKKRNEKLKIENNDK